MAASKTCRTITSNRGSKFPKRLDSRQITTNRTPLEMTAAKVWLYTSSEMRMVENRNPS